MALMTEFDDTAYDAAVGANSLPQLFNVLETENGLPRGYLQRTAQIESGMRPNAQNPNSSAGGLFQFINSTAQRYGLADKMDPVQSTLAAAQLASDNADVLRRRLGREPTAGELYLAHQQGAGGAAKLLANPDAPAASVVGSAAARLNGGAGLTAGQLANRWTSKFGDPTNPPGGARASQVDLANMPAEDAAETAGSTGGSGFNVPGRSGLMNEPYKAEAEGWTVPVGNAMEAIGMSLLSGTRQNPLGDLPKYMLAQNAARERREEGKYGIYKDQRDFGLRQSEVERAQANTTFSQGLQRETLDASKSDRAADNARQDAAARAPTLLPRADGSILSIPKDGSADPREIAPAIKQVDATEVLRNYAAAKREGFAGSFLDYQKELKASGATQVNVDTKGAGKFAEAAGTFQAKRYGEMATAADDAVGLKADIDTLGTLMEGINTGKGAEARMGLAQYAKAAGFDSVADGLTSGKLGEMEAAQAITAKIIPRMRVPGSGTTSDKDLATFAQSVPSLLKTPGGNKIILDTFKSLYDHQASAGEIAGRALRGEIPQAEADTAIKRLANPFARLKGPEEAAKPAKVKTQTEYDALPPGALYEDPFGKMRKKGGP